MTAVKTDYLTRRLAESLWSYNADEPHFDEDGPGHYPDVTWAEIAAHLETPHHGDCVGQAVTCARCVAESIVHEAMWVARRLRA